MTYKREHKQPLLFLDNQIAPPVATGNRRPPPCENPNPLSLRRSPISGNRSDVHLGAAAVPIHSDPIEGPPPSQSSMGVHRGGACGAL